MQVMQPNIVMNYFCIKDILNDDKLDHYIVHQ